MKDSVRLSRLFATLLILVPPVAKAEVPSVTVRRFALIVGVNDGGPDRVTLKYAASDAETFARVMEELGGLAREDLILLLNPDRTTLEKSLTKLSAMLVAGRARDRRVEALFYYWGHSDETGVMIGKERIDYRQLRQAMQILPADVRIAVVDSCSSGVLTREKGGKRRPPFLVDASTQLTGHAFLTSSSATEAAQESDRIAASFFTHFLVSGLRGAADTSGDGRVTLTEAYQFAFNETLARTESSRAGAQHPNYDIDLTGSGDLVMTDLRTTNAALVLGESLAGRFYVRDQAARLVVELYKLPDRAVELGLAPGDYQVTLDQDGALSRTAVQLIQGGRTELASAQFRQLDGEVTTVRGEAGKTAPPVPAVASTWNPADYEIEYVSATIIPTVSSRKDRKVLRYAGVNLLAGYSDRLHGVELSPGVNANGEEVRGVQFSGGVNLNRGTLTGAQFAGAANISGAGTGAMLAGAINTATGAFTGMQAAGAINIVNGDLQGFQAAGGVNLSRGNARAALQTAGAVNLVSGQMLGAQAAGALNLAGGVRGAQISVVNISGDVTGTQIGVVNVATGSVRGTQLGVVNVAGKYLSGVPLGVVSLVKDCSPHLEFWASDLAPANLAVRTNITEHAYTLLNVGYAPGMNEEFLSSWSQGKARLAIGFGAGAWVPIVSDLAFRLDGIVSNVFLGDRLARLNHNNSDMQVQIRAAVNYAVLSHLGFFAGAGLSSYLTFDSHHDSSALAHELPDASWSRGSFTARFWPALFAGLHF